MRKLRLLAVSGLLLLAGCVAVKPWQRGDHARRAMTAGFGDDGIAGGYRGKVLETKTAGGAARQAPGGGCGCSQ
jgi:hypothetical protein